MPYAPNDTLQQLFLNLIDSCTSWHISILKLFQNPESWALENNHQFPNWSKGGLSEVIESAYPNLKEQQDLYRLVWHELYRGGLINTERLTTMMTGNGMLSKRTTDIGDKFVLFISDPKI